MSALLAVFALSAFLPSELPSIVVLPVEAKGAKPELASLLTDTLTQELRASGALGRIMGTQEVQAAISLESQRQLLQCDSEGCLAELAGSLGAEYLLASSLGTVGEYYSLNLKLISAKSGTLAGSAGARVCAKREGELLAVMGPAVRRVLSDARLMAGNVAQESLTVACSAPPPVAAAPVPAPAPAPAAQPAPAKEEGGGPGVLGIILRVGGGGLLLAAVLPAVLVLGGVLAAVGSFGVANLTTAAPGSAFYYQLMVPNLGGWALAAVSLVVHAVLVTGGFVLVLTSIVAG
jgi:hypothetical protein